MPDIDCRARKRAAALSVQQGDTESQGHAGRSLGNVATQLCALDIVRTLLLSLVKMQDGGCPFKEGNVAAASKKRRRLSLGQFERLGSIVDLRSGRSNGRSRFRWSCLLRPCHTRLTL